MMAGRRAVLLPPRADAQPAVLRTAGAAAERPVGAAMARGRVAARSASRGAPPQALLHSRETRRWAVANGTANSPMASRGESPLLRNAAYSSSRRRLTPSEPSAPASGSSSAQSARISSAEFAAPRRPHQRHGVRGATERRLTARDDVTAVRERSDAKGRRARVPGALNRSHDGPQHARLVHQAVLQRGVFAQTLDLAAAVQRQPPLGGEA